MLDKESILKQKRKERSRQYYLKNKAKYIERQRNWRRDKKGVVSKKICDDCFLCKKEFFIKFVSYKKRYSLKNDWDYWTGQKIYQGKKICDDCLVNLYRNKKKEFFCLIPDLSRRQILRGYLSDGFLSEKRL